MIVILFIVIKLILYTFWCWYGIRLLAPFRKRAPAIAFGLALARLIVGFALGLAWTYSVHFLVPSREYSRLGFDPVTFIVGLFVLRLLLWSGMSYLIKMPTGKLSLLRVSGKDWLWRLGGVGLSFLADVGALFGVVGTIC